MISWKKHRKERENNDAVASGFSTMVDNMGNSLEIVDLEQEVIKQEDFDDEIFSDNNPSDDEDFSDEELLCEEEMAKAESGIEISLDTDSNSAEVFVEKDIPEEKQQEAEKVAEKVAEGITEEITEDNQQEADDIFRKIPGDLRQEVTEEEIEAEAEEEIEAEAEEETEEEIEEKIEETEEETEGIEKEITEKQSEDVGEDSEGEPIEELADKTEDEFEEIAEKIPEEPRQEEISEAPEEEPGEVSETEAEPHIEIRIESEEECEIEIDEDIDKEAGSSEDTDYSTVISDYKIADEGAAPNKTFVEFNEPTAPGSFFCLGELVGDSNDDSQPEEFRTTEGENENLSGDNSETDDYQKESQEPEDKPDPGLTIVIVLLALNLIVVSGVCVYYATHLNEVNHFAYNVMDSYNGKSQSGGTSCKEHIFMPATCVNPKTCEICGETSGEPLGHTTRIGKCSRCGQWQTELEPQFNEIVQACGQANENINQAVTAILSSDMSSVESAYDACLMAYDMYAKAIDNFETAYSICDRYEEFGELKHEIRKVIDAIPAAKPTMDYDSVLTYVEAAGSLYSVQVECNNYITGLISEWGLSSENTQN